MARAAGVPGPASGSVHVESLGRPDCQVTTAQGTYRLSRRHGEILTLLASEPRGAVGEALALEVYGETSQSLSTLRAEMARLRSMLGGDIVQSRPYRLAGSVTIARLGASASVSGSGDPMRAGPPSVASGRTRWCAGTSARRTPSGRVR